MGASYGMGENNMSAIINKKFLKGMCYAPFSHGYNPSVANNTCIWFGSDIATYNIKPLWGDSFFPIDGPDAGKIFTGRNDLQNLKDLGVNLIRLYDWDSRNNHIPFLDYCNTLGIQVLVPVSNYNLGAFGPPPDMTKSITGLINSFSNTGDSLGTDYHPAIYGITIGSETDQQSQIPNGYVVQYTKEWVSIEEQLYDEFRKVPIGHPISFAMNGPGWSGEYPCFGYLEQLLPTLLTDTMRDLNKRLILCPHTYNEANYLYNNAEGSGHGWVDLAWNKYQLPIFFCEIGCSRMVRSDYKKVIENQIEKSIAYAKENKDKLLGICYFQYCDKVWMPNTTEGSFGAVTNSDQVTDIVHYGQKDFAHSNGFSCDNNYLNIQVLSSNPSLDVIKNAYKV